MTTTVAIAGLTGKFAQCVASVLQTYSDVSIRGFCRSPEKLPECLISETNVEVIKGEFDDASAVLEFVRGADVVICCYFGSPEVMVRGQKLLVDACEQACVSRYIASDFAVDYTKIPAGALFPKESARIIRDYLASKNVAGVHILTGGLMETFWSEFFGCWDRNTQSLSFWGTGEEKWDLTTYETAAAYTAAAALDKSAVGVLRFRGDRKNMLEIKEIFNEVYHAPVHLVALGSVKELYKEVQELFNNNLGDVMRWAPKCFAYWCIQPEAHLGDALDNDRYPNVQPTDLKRFFHSHRMEDLHRADQRLGYRSRATRR
ncbi:elongation factor 1-gamma [Aspergillus udagawae]|nr:elongation factor 1-gamma [Aspergillus udagawae]